MKTLLVLFLFLGSGLSVASQAKSEWKDFSPADADCTVSMPGVPMLDSSSGASEYVLSTDYVIYKVTCVQNPAAALVKPKDAPAMKIFFDKYIARMETSEHIKALQQTDFDVDGNYGREVKFDSGELILINRYIAAGKFLHVLITMTYKENDGAPAVVLLRRKFLDSLRFKPDK